ncbi:ribonuclease H-like domain-containing protein [Truncatella angustata]|uniref:Ribonuclease H-like domain-containing protein n=1 Tax=Truncatella angustata TaxID=152316 RepID=A0A9P8ZZG8_9PEZI|nr:ribonuclease H-like domain-containing protein [Truncatella angustata]KAH6656033.1 ribonuclease H-like domain-containing protein [Truncatella angustata]KAH8194317.1 hypothetical protein TruAng_011511 [Truncatella angustata]
MTTTVQIEKKHDENSVTAVTTFLEGVHIQKSAPYSFIDTPTKLSAVLDSIYDLPTNPPSLYIDLEGENLSRHGTISILQLFISSTEQTYLIDIHTLEDMAFTTGNKDGLTLKDILESSMIPKVFFDVRNDSDALYSHYKISLQGVQDLQLMELATRCFPGRFINGLAKCIERDLRLSSNEKIAWQNTKEKGLHLFAPERGGSYKVFNERPISEAIKLYCVQDVKFLPRLWSHYNSLLTVQKREKVRLASSERVRESQSLDYQSHGRQKALIPKGW